MRNIKETFSQYTNEALLERRALGDQLSEEAHQAIEDIFNERGEILPPRPMSSILHGKDRWADRGFVEKFGWIIAVGAVIIISKALAHTWLGIPLSILIICVWGVSRIRKSTLSKEDGKRDQEAQVANEEGLTDLMVAAAEGNVQRAEDLINYGADVNAKSLNGSTPLMYAARNNNASIIELLLNHGADSGVTNLNKSTALSIAQNFKQYEAIAILVGNQK